MSWLVVTYLASNNVSYLVYNMKRIEIENMKIVSRIRNIVSRVLSADSIPISISTDVMKKLHLPTMV